VKEVQKFLGEVVLLQERIAAREKALDADQEFKNPNDITIEDETVRKPPEVSLDLLEEVVVPATMKPYINREVNFKMFTEILTERIDKSRISITLPEFQQIEFCEMGLPRFVTRILALLTQEPHRDLVRKKARHVYGLEEYDRLLEPRLELEEANRRQDADGELFDIRNIMHNLQGKVDFGLYEAVFRTLCDNAESD